LPNGDKFRNYAACDTGSGAALTGRKRRSWRAQEHFVFCAVNNPTYARKRVGGRSRWLTLGILFGIGRRRFAS